MRLAVTGHRPPKLGGYAAEQQDKVVAFATLTLAEYKPDEVITGMALGWDQAIARACVRLGIPFTAAVPFVGQERTWPVESQEVYRELVGAAQYVMVVSAGGYADWKMHHRNHWMVEHCDALGALWDGSNGGTAGCVEYANRVKRRVIHRWDAWQAFLAEVG